MEKHKKNIMILCITGLLSAASVVNLSLFFYRSYQRELIQTEQDQLLTMARTVGKSLVSYIMQELTALDLYFGTAGSREGADTRDELEHMALCFLEEKGRIYDAMACYGPSGNLLFSKGDCDFPSLSSGPDKENAIIGGKQLSKKGWYQMFLSRSFLWNGSFYRIVYAMNLNRLYEEIVAPVQIGKGGYSIVKDQELAIIMHHASDQIGIDAVYDRSRLYPQLDLTGLFSWITLQQTQSEGQGIVDSYMWDHPDLLSQKRIVAYTTIELPGEEWIVNSTLPLEELDKPLSHMMMRLAALSAFFLLFLMAFVYFMTNSINKADAQRKQIAYLKEINEGMELLRRKDEELNRYYRMQSIGQMSSHIAHEFNNYLTPVMLYGEILENDASISPENQELIRGIIGSVEQAKNLSRRLLDFSRQDSYGKQIRQNLCEETAKVAQVISRMAPKNITVRTDISPSPLFTFGPKGMMNHLLLNLCNNAFHAMEGMEGVLNIMLKEESSQDAEPGSVCGILSVSDTGCGISKEALHKIFDPFYTTKRSGKGTGLGLSVVQNIMDSVKGQVRIESREGQGTSFYLSFPLIPPDEGAKEPQKPCFHKLIIVDDDTALLKSLKAKGIPGEYYDHPAAALSRLQRDPDCCDMLLTDYSMPSINGLELAQMVRRLNPHIYLALMSGSDAIPFESSIANGAIDCFIAKTELSEKLSGLLAPSSL